MTPDTQAMTLRVPPDVHERLRKLAFDRRVSINSIVVAFIIAKLAELDASDADSGASG